MIHILYFTVHLNEYERLSEHPEIVGRIPGLLSFTRICSDSVCDQVCVRQGSTEDQPSLSFVSN